MRTFFQTDSKQSSFVYGLLMYLGILFSSQVQSAQLVIIIDDIGNNYAQGSAMAGLKGHLTLAFLPHTPYAKKLALEAFQNNKEIILHAPMENSTSAPLGPGGLTHELSKDEFQTTLNKAISSLPHVQGVNNHMGSALTQNTKEMGWVMEILKQHELYFVDSLTSPKSIAYQQALQYQLPALKRQVFLDNNTNESSLNRQWYKALRIAKNKGHAVLIGHPYDESYKFLAKKIPQLKSEGVELIPASQIFLQDAWQKFDLDNKNKHAANITNRYLLNSKNNRETKYQKLKNKNPDLISQSNLNSKL
jgi:polysaccharide deacetylase 2 family uncharacterized protein YibQ